MKWIKIKIENYDKLNYPDECPNCLGKPANQLVNFQRVLIIPGVVTITYRIDWPHCKECFGFAEQRYHIRKIYQICALIALGVVAVGLVLLAVNDYSNAYSFLYALSIFALIALGLFIKYRSAVAKLPIGVGHIRKGDAVKLIEFDTWKRTGESTVKIAFLNPIYAKIFIEKNISKNPKYSAQALKAALEENDLRELGGQRN